MTNCFAFILFPFLKMKELKDELVGKMRKPNYDHISESTLEVNYENEIMVI